jgi:Peptidase family M23
MPHPPRQFASVLIFIALLTLALPASALASDSPDKMTPLLLQVLDAPVPFAGSDGSTHVVYELVVTNFSSAEVAVEKVEVLGDGVVLQTLDPAAIAIRLQPAGQRESTGSLARSTQGLLFLHVVLAPGAQIPHELTHRISARVSAAPPGHQELTETGGPTTIDRQSIVVIGPPLQGSSYISADSCCDATRHTRAALPINGRVWISQRMAVDWEQLDAQGRVYSGPREKLESYTIFGKPVLAVADAVVVDTANDEPEQTPGEFPDNISLTQADGNFVILDLGQNRYALYAHMQPGSVRVHEGDHVARGQVIGLVGNTGNSVAPHLHFQVMAGQSSFASNGLPYEIDSFQVTGKTPGTAAFDEAEAKGTPLAVTPVSPPRDVTNALPLDQLIISFKK